MVVGALVQRLCHVQQGEGRRAFQFASLAFLCAATTFAGLAVADGFFLSAVGPQQLTKAFLLAAIVLVIGSWMMFRWFSRSSVKRVFCGLMGMALVYFTSLTVIDVCDWHHNAPFFWLICKTGAEVYLVLIYTASWSFIDQCFKLEDAERLYGLFSGAAMVGAAVGSGAVAVTIDLLGAAGIWAVLALAHVGLLVLVHAISRNSHGQAAAQMPKHEESRDDPLPFRQLLLSPFMFYLIGLSIMMLILQILTEYHYMKSISDALGVGDDVVEQGAILARFLGGCRGWIFVGNVIFGVFLYGRMIRRIGIRNAILLPAASFVVLFLFWLRHDCLALGVLGMIMDEGISIAIEDNNFHLLFNSVSHRSKARLRVIVEQVIEPVGMLVGSLLLMLFHYNKLVALAVATTSLLFAVGVRVTYSLIASARVKEDTGLSMLPASQVPENVA